MTLVPLGLAAETPNPTFFELDLKRRLLFAVNEIDQFEGKPTGVVSAFSIGATGKLALINQRPSMGPSPCHLALDGEARNLLVTNCGDGSVTVLPVAADGKLGDATEVIKGAGAASVALDRAGKFSFVCDHDSDKVMKFSPNSMHMAISLPDTNQALASRIDEGNGRLKPSGIFAEMPAPAAVRFLPPAGGEK